MSRTPRREAAAGTPTTVVAAAVGHARERALQDPGLKDYVRWFGAVGLRALRGKSSCAVKRGTAFFVPGKSCPRYPPSASFDEFVLTYFGDGLETRRLHWQRSVRLCL